jgi:chromosome transmission fidelity protein 4
MPGPTFLSYTPNGQKLVTVGQNNAIRVFQSGSDEEPAVIDNCQDANTAVVAAVLAAFSPLSASFLTALE